MEFSGPLRGAYANTREWLSDFQQSVHSDTQCIAFPPEDPVIRSEPKGFNPIVNERFERHLLNNPLANQFVAVIPNGRICGANGTVVSPDNFLLWDLSPELDGKAVSEHSILKCDSFPPVTHTPETLGVLTCPVAYHYYHWLFEVFARLDLLNRSGVKIDRYVINRNHNISFQNDTLAALSMSDDQIINCSELTHIQAHRLVVPSFAAYTAHVPQWACDFLRKKLLVGRHIQRHNGYERIYVSREDCKWRKVVNEEEVVRCLQSHGFRVVVPGMLSLKQQIEIFASAEVVVGPHGTGLTNLLYCHPRVKVIEFLTPSFLDPTFWGICNNVELQYYYLVVDSAKGLKDGWDGADDMIVNIGELQKILRLAGIGLDV